jgi:hypothetical protein
VVLMASTPVWGTQTAQPFAAALHATWVIQTVGTGTFGVGELRVFGNGALSERGERFAAGEHGPQLEPPRCRSRALPEPQE